MRRICVIDNSTLVNLTKVYHLKIFVHLRSIFHAIHIPLAVKMEYEAPAALQIEPERAIILGQMRVNEGFLSICSQYETISLQFLKTTKGIDAGEAEAAAQHIFINSNYILSDDMVFIGSVKRLHPHIKIISTLHLVAWLDYAGIIEGPQAYLNALYSHWNFKQSDLQNAYKEIGNYLGINVSKSDFRKKTSFRVLGIMK